MNSWWIDKDADAAHDQANQSKVLNGFLAQSAHDERACEGSYPVAEVQELHPWLHSFFVYFNGEGLAEYIDTAAPDTIE